MTVAAGYRDQYIAEGSRTSYDFTFAILDETHLRVFYNDGSSETELSLGSDYTVSTGPWPNGGTITLLDPPAELPSIILTIIRNVPLTQDTDLKNQGSMYREAVETALDKAVMMVQQQQEALDRTAQLTPSALAFDPTIPPPQPGYVLRCKVDQSGFEWVPVPESVVVVEYPIAVGGIYITVSTANPASELGYGSWSLVGAGRALVGQDAGDADFNALEETGGAKTVTLTTDQIPAHSHTLTDVGHSHGITDPGHIHNIADIAAGLEIAAGGDYAVIGAQTTVDPSNVTVDSATTGISAQNTGGGQSHSNMPPYYVVRFWKRTA